MTKRKIGVLVMSYGTPESLDQIEAYYTHIRRGHPPTAEQLQDLTNRYERIVGGFFPLRANTDRQVEALQQALMHVDDEVEYVCYQGLKHASPLIEDGVQAMVNDGLTEAIGIVLAPHYSVMSIGAYMKRAKAKADELGLNIRFVQSYHDHPLLIEALSSRLEQTLTRFAPARKDEVKVLFSAHSLPEKILEMNDPYPDQLNETSTLIADKVGITDWQFVWQSAGQTSMPWLGPDILQVIEQLANEQEVKRIVVCPIGFVSDHLEVLYDLDIECKQLADSLGIQFERTPSLNTDPLYMAVLTDKVRQAMKMEENVL